MFKRIISELKRVWSWLGGKRSEIHQLNYKDAFMAHLVLEIMQTSPKPKTKVVPLYSLIPIHPVDNREATIESTKKRAGILATHKKKILKEGSMTKELSAKYLPSLTYIRGVSSGSEYYTFEGNGRVAALKAVFLKNDNLDIEIEVFQPKKQGKAIKKIKKLRRMHRML
ncbi:hypothetical protein HON52_00490 [Candidatus Uhrbacteria bacterium]|jgi:hypothetical protein|nr:hypothetical protein [Candidatus Uhrbacteria bacterium]